MYENFPQDVHRQLTSTVIDSIILSSEAGKILNGFSKILENKPLLYGLIGGLVVVLALFITVGIVVSSNNSGAPKAVKEKVIDKPLDLLTTDNLGKAIEIQALLAREGITVERRADGQKSVLYLAKYTMTQRDRALLAIVKSGLVDQNIGLEIFDKGDFTSTKEDKRIRLTRAINGELSRLIRKSRRLKTLQFLFLFLNR